MKNIPLKTLIVAVAMLSTGITSTVAQTSDIDELKALMKAM